MAKIRLDQLIFDRGLTESRERAKTSVMSGIVFVNGQRADKPGMSVALDCNVEVRGETLKYVSRGGLKIEKALSVFEYDPKDLVCIDCGASTGGFTDCLLQNGAKKVYAVDVGYGQLAWSLRTDDRVVSMERTNIRNVTPEDINERFDLAVMDLSFISLKLVIPAVSALLKENGDILCLIKPQFEAGKNKVGKKGVVREPEIHEEVLFQFLDYTKDAGFSVIGMNFSPVKGPEGNIEYLAWLKKGDFESRFCVEPTEIVKLSHSSLKQTSEGLNE